MGFENLMQEATYKKVKQFLDEILDSDRVFEWGETSFAIIRGSAFVHIGVYPFGKREAVVRCICYLVQGANITPELMRLLLGENSRFIFGAFGVDEDGDITFSHTIVGSTLNREELKASVEAVASISDQYDDKLVAKFGGKTSMDVIQEKRKEAAARRGASGAEARVWEGYI